MKPLQRLYDGKNIHRSLHADILDRFGHDWKPGTIRWILAKDQLVTCDLRMRLLAGSFEPLVVKIRQYLADNGPCSLSEVTDCLGYSQRAAERIVAEILNALLKAGEVFIEGEKFECAKSSKWEMFRSCERVVEARVRYIPRSGQLGADIPGVDTEWIEQLAYLHKIRWWEHPAGSPSIAVDNLSREIENACLTRGGSLVPPISSNDSRAESLQRSHLIAPGDRIIGCTAINTALSSLWTIHRCYLFRSRIPGEASGDTREREWNVRVYRFPQGGEEDRYSLYFADQAEQDDRVIDSIVAASMPLY